MKHLGDITKISGCDALIVDIVCGGWMMIPDKYQRNDETLHRMYADFVTEADWRHERLLKAIEQHKKNYFSGDELIVIDEDERFRG